MNNPAPQEKALPFTSDDLFAKLKELNISYKFYEHEPIFTVAEGEHLEASIPGLHCRNLFIRDKKKRMFLIVAANETSVDMKKMPDLLGCGRLSFGSADRLWQYLGIKPGSVNPFCVFNDKEKQVKVILDKNMMSAELVNYHPMDNSMTIGITPQDVVSFLDAIGHPYETLDLCS